jgi:hypothetical protein
MEKIISAIGIGCLILVCTSVAIRAENKTARVEDSPSFKHFTESGSFFAGKSFTTWQEFPDVSTANAFKRAYAFIAKNGYTIVSSDKDMGVISATQGVISQAAKTVPLNTLIEHSGHGGSKVTITFSLSGGMVSQGVRGFFAKVMDAVGKNSEADIIPPLPPMVTANSINSEVLTNDSIVQLVKAGMPEEIVINKIKTQPTSFVVGAGEYSALKTNGVSDKIINEMVLRGQGAGATSQASPSSPVESTNQPITVVPMQPPNATTNIITDPVIEKLCQQLEQDNPGKVKDALNKLRDKKLESNASQAVPKILPCLANSKPDVVIAACRTLAKIGNQDAVPALLPLLTNERPDIIREACRTLADIGNKDTIPSLEPLLTNLDHGISDEARKAIIKLRAKS